MGQFAAFLCYARIDDDDDGVTGLRRSLETELRKQAGEAMPIFQDRRDIFVGQQWRDRILRSIDGSTLLVVVITPSLLRSEFCRVEIKAFADREEQLGRSDLIIPILYIRTPGLSDPEDDIAMTLASRQYVDWEDLRFESNKSIEVRKRVAELARQMVMAIESSQQRAQATAVVEKSLACPEEDGPGFIELLAESEEAMPLFIQTLHSLTEVANDIGNSMKMATEEIQTAESRGRPSSMRLAAFYRLANRLEISAEGMEQHTNDYLDNLTRVSGGINALIARVPHLTNEDEVEAAENLLPALVELATNITTALSSLEGMRQSFIANYSLSSTLRPALKRIVDAAYKIIPSGAVFEAWRDDLTCALEKRLLQDQTDLELTSDSDNNR